jgi:hypothetical protein
MRVKRFKNFPMWEHVKHLRRNTISHDTCSRDFVVSVDSLHDIGLPWLDRLNQRIW